MEYRFLTIRSPAKLNLSLRVLGQRRDGFHELFTLFHRISLEDTLRLEKKEKGIQVLCRPPLIPQKDNLIVRAFHRLRSYRPFKGGVRVYLEKQIPVGGGLGGGSSNAAAFLLAANRFFHLGLNHAQLMKIGASLGSDIPFFISDVLHAMGRGRGERITPLPFQRRLWFLLFPSAKGLSTRKVYRNLRPRGPHPSLTRLRHDAKIASACLAKGRVDEASRFLINDLMESTEGMRPSLKKTREKLSALGFGTCQMSGSGPTQFMIFPTPSRAQHALREFRRHGFRKVILCHSD